jgi:hypothetical protein
MKIFTNSEHSDENNIKEDKNTAIDVLVNTETLSEGNYFGEE